MKKEQIMTTYRSKIGIGLLLFVNLTLLGIFLIPLFSHDRESRIALLIILLIILPIWVLINYMLFSIKYVIDHQNLTIKSGVFCTQVLDIQSIKKIEKTRSMLSSPAASLDRLEITYNKWDFVFISPKDKAAFVAQLKQLNPEIIVKI
jgi:hypothetical protein